MKRRAVRRCAGITATGKRCLNNAMRGSDMCGPHDEQRTRTSTAVDSARREYARSESTTHHRYDAPAGNRPVEPLQLLVDRAVDQARQAHAVQLGRKPSEGTRCQLCGRGIMPGMHWRRVPGGFRHRDCSVAAGIMYARTTSERQRTPTREGDDTGAKVGNYRRGDEMAMSPAKAARVIRNGKDKPRTFDERYSRGGGGTDRQR